MSRKIQNWGPTLQSLVYLSKQLIVKFVSLVYMGKLGLREVATIDSSFKKQLYR